MRCSFIKCLCCFLVVFSVFMRVVSFPNTFKRLVLKYIFLIYLIPSLPQFVDHISLFFYRSSLSGTLLIHKIAGGDYPDFLLTFLPFHVYRNTNLLLYIWKNSPLIFHHSAWKFQVVTQWYLSNNGNFNHFIKCYLYFTCWFYLDVINFSLTNGEY